MLTFACFRTVQPVTPLTRLGKSRMEKGVPIGKHSMIHSHSTVQLVSGSFDVYCSLDMENALSSFRSKSCVSYTAYDGIIILIRECISS